MKWSFAALGMIVFGLIGFTIILLFEQITTNNESDYYLLKEATEAAMIESIDISHYRKTSEVRIVKEKFVENFLRRFAKSTIPTNNGYVVEFYDLYDMPPKVTIVINTGVRDYTLDYRMNDQSYKTDFTVVNNLTSILEYLPYSNNGQYSVNEMTKTYYFIADRNSYDGELGMNIPEELDVSYIKDVKIVGLGPTSGITTQAEVSKAYFDTMLYFSQLRQSNNTYTLSIDECRNTSGSVTKADGNAERKLRLNISNDNNRGCVAVKFDVQWSYSEYRIN